MKIQLLSMAAAAGLVAGCSSMGNHDNNNMTSAMTLDQLPPAAQSTIRNEVGDNQIYRIKQESMNGETAYKVEVDRSQFYQVTRPALVVSQDGSILKESRELSKGHDMNEAAGAQNNTSSNRGPNNTATDATTSPNGNFGTQSGSSNANSPASTTGSTQAPREANPSGTSPAEALPSTSGNGAQQ